MEKPIIDNGLDGFRIIFRHRSMTEQESASYSRRNVLEAVLDFASTRESVSAKEIADAAGISKKTARGCINALMDEGVLEGIGSLNSPKRRYRLTRRRVDGSDR